MEILINQGDYPYAVEFESPRDISVVTNSNLGASFHSNGLLKSISIDQNSPHFPIHLEFLKYGVRRKSETSGAYLFLPDGPAVPFVINTSTSIVLISRGNLESTVTTGLPFVLHETILRDGGAIEIRNSVDIGDMVNTEIVMRLSTGIRSDDIFYTDLNGFQVSFILIDKFRWSSFLLYNSLFIS